MAKITLIGLGSAGCNIVDKLSQYNEYICFKLDTNENPNEKSSFYRLEEQDTSEKYEEKCPDLTEFFVSVTSTVYFIVGGSGKISGASLKILKHIKDREIHILYVRPEIKLLSNLAIAQERIVFNVLQEYARSGLFKRIVLLSNPVVELTLGDLAVVNYYAKLNEFICNSIYNIDYLTHAVAALDNIESPKDSARICTFGVYDIEKDTNNLLYPLEDITDIQYHFALTEKTLREDGKFFKDLREKIKSKITENTKVSYSIHSVEGNFNYCFITAYSNQIQG